MAMELQFHAEAVRKLATPQLHLHSSQANDDTGSAWISARTDSYGPRAYAFGCEPGTPLSHINANLDSYDRLNEPLDISEAWNDLASKRHLFVVFDGTYKLFATDSEELGDIYTGVE
jgi:hypothetical protein